MKTCVFFEEGTHDQFTFILTKYQEALVTKAHAKSSKPENLIKLDKWFQTELPKKIKSRGTEGRFLTHEEIVQCIKWKLARGQFRPRLKDLVQMNTPRVVMQETKKAFRHIYKKNDLESAVQALSNLKGVGPGLASAVLAAGAPHIAPFMADECLLSLPDMEGIDYTLKEYMKLVEKTKECVERLNSQGGSWTPHNVELAVWTHYVARDLKPELLEDMPDSKSSSATKSPAKSAESPAKSAESPVKAPTPIKPSNDSEDSNEAATSEEDTTSTKTTNGVNGVHATEEKSNDENSEKEVEESTKSTVSQEESVTKEETLNNSNDTNTAVELTTTATAESSDDSSTATTNGDSSDTKSENQTSAQATTEEKDIEEQPAVEKAAVVEQPKVAENGVTVQSSNGGSPTKEIVNGSGNATEEYSVKNGMKATEASPEKKQNGNSSSITKEDTFNGDTSSAKRSLEPEDSDLSEAKRLKEDTAAIPHPIQAN